LERERVLSSRRASSFTSAAIALLEIRSGERTDQMNVTVSSKRRNSVAPFQKGVRLFLGHRLPPIRVYFFHPIAQSSKFGLRVPAFFVRTMSTTGWPWRVIVTGSPFSTALINSGNLFFASAMLTCMSNDSYLKPAYSDSVKA
jgi:hypothetical protein